MYAQPDQLFLFLVHWILNLLILISFSHGCWGSCRSILGFGTKRHYAHCFETLMQESISNYYFLRANIQSWFKPKKYFPNFQPQINHDHNDQPWVITLWRNDSDDLTQGYDAEHVYEKAAVYKSMVNHRRLR